MPTTASSTEKPAGKSEPKSDLDQVMEHLAAIRDGARVTGPVPAGPHVVATTAAMPRRARLEVLGDCGYRWHRAGDAAGARNLSKRHAEILVLLQSFPDGLGTEQLALMLADYWLTARRRA